MNDIINLSKNEPNAPQILLITDSFSVSQIPSILGATYNKDGNIVINQNISDAYIRIGGAWNQFRHIEGEKTARKLKALLDGTITELTPDDFGNIKTLPYFSIIGPMNLSSVKLPDTMTDIGEYNFIYCNIQNLDTGNGLNNNGFRNLNQYLSFTTEQRIQNYNIGKNITTLENSSLGYLGPLNVTISEENEYLLSYKGCVYNKDKTILQFVSAGLSEINFAEGVKEIGEDACQRHPNLKRIILPNTIEKINNAGFYECYEVEEIFIPNSVTYFDQYAFWDCGKDGTIINWDNTTNTATFETVSFRTSTPKIFNVTSLKNFLNSSFYGANSSPAHFHYLYHQGAKVENLIIPSGVSEIKNNTFYGNTGIKSLNTGDEVTRIGDHAFYNCSTIESVELGINVTKLDTSAFSECAALKTIISRPTTPPYARSAFQGSTTKPDHIYVPAESVDAYKAADGWKSYASKIQPIQS